MRTWLLAVALGSTTAVASTDGPLRLCASTAQPGVIYSTNVECPHGTELDRTTWTGAWRKAKIKPADQKPVNQGAAHSTSAALAKKAQQVQVGMTADGVRSVLGRPTSINASLDGTGKREQWVYEGDKFLRSQYVYFGDNGLVTSVQISK